MLTRIDFKIDVAVNAPQAGTIKELLAKEEDTVTVGQDLVKLELGGGSQEGGKQQASQDPKAPAPKDQSTSSDPKPDQPQHKETPLAEARQSKPKPEQEPPKEKEGPSPPAREQRKEPRMEGSQTPPPREDAVRSEPKAAEPKADSMSTPFGGRGERRVSCISPS